MTIALVLFLVAAVGGLIMAVRIFRGQLAPWALSLGHAALGAAGLVLLLIAIVQGSATALATAALIVLLLAALGGFLLASFHLRGRLAPKTIVAVHALAAVAGVVILAIALFG